MRFRPCIDIHNGKVKQIVGGTLTDSGAAENFVSDKDAGYFAELYRKHGLYGGHAILLNKKGTPEYEADKKQAFAAFAAFPDGIQAGGGIDINSAGEFIDAGAAAVIVTSAVFHDGQIDYDMLRSLSDTVSAAKLVLDLSVRRRGDEYIIVTDRWQKYTETALYAGTLDRLSAYCGEFLVHAADVEGKRNGIDTDVVRILSESPIPATYAGGIASEDDIRLIAEYGKGKVDLTVGSALDIFGGDLAFDRLIGLVNALK